MSILHQQIQLQVPPTASLLHPLHSCTLAVASAQDIPAPVRLMRFTKREILKFLKELVMRSENVPFIKVCSCNSVGQCVSGGFPACAVAWGAPSCTPPLKMAKVLESPDHIWSQFGAEGAGNFFFQHTVGGAKFSFCVYTQNAQNFMGNPALYAKHEKFSDR